MNRRSRSNLSPSRRLPVLPARARWASRLLVALPLLALFVASGIYFTKLARVLRAGIAPVAANELTRQLGHQVRVGAVDFAPGELIVTNVAMSSRHTWAGSRNEALAVVPRAVIHYNLHDLLFDSGNAAHAIGEIDLDSPEALLVRWQDHQGKMRFNFSDVIDTFTKLPKRPHAKPFQGRIVARNATVHFRDFMAPARVHERPAYNTVTNLNGTVGFASERIVTVDATAQGVMPKLAAVAVKGDISRQAAGRFRLDAKVSDADATYWSSYFVQASKVTAKVYATGGRAALDMTFARLGSKPPPGLPLDLSGVVWVRNVSGVLTDPRVKHISLRGLTGTATFTGDGVTIDGDVVASDQRVHVNGTVFDFVTPQLAFTAQSKRIDALRLARDLPQITLPPGLGVAPGAVSSKITGTPDNPVVTFLVDTPLVTFRGNRLTDVHARGLYANYVTRLSPVTFHAGGTGQGALRVTIYTKAKTPTVSIGGRIANVNLAALRLPPGAGKIPALGGIADIAFLANDQNQPLGVTANVTVAHPRVGPTKLRLALGRVQWAGPGRPLTISRALVEDNSGGVATVSGQVPISPTEPLNLAVNAAGANIGQLLAPYSQADLGGTAFAQGRVTGTLNNPRVTALTQLYGARYGSLRMDAVTGLVTATPNGLTLQNVVVRRFPTEVSVSGDVTELASRNPRLDLAVNLRQGDVQDLIGLANQLAPPARAGSKPPPLASPALDSLTGTAQGSFHVAGRVQSPTVSGTAAIKNATFDAYRLSNLSANFAYQNDTVRVFNAAARTPDGTTVKGHGHYGLKSQQFAAALTGRDFPLSLLDPYTLQYADVEGVAGFSVNADGTLKSPLVDATLALRDLSVNNQTLDTGTDAPLTVSAHYANGVVTKTGAPLEVVAHYPLTHVSDGSITTDTATTRYIINDLSLSLPTPQEPERRSLTLSAQIPESEPERLEHLENTLRASKFAQTTAGQTILGRLDALTDSPQGNLWAPSVTVSGPLKAPRIAATVKANDLALGDENHIDNVEVAVSPTGGASASNHVDLKAGGLRFSGIPINTLTAHADFDPQTVTVQSVDARSAQAYLHAAGTAGLSDNGQIAATLDASNVPLALFNSLSNAVAFLKPTYDSEGHQVATRRLAGEIGNLTVAASGRTLAPDLTASLSLDQPALEVTTYSQAGDPSVTLKTPKMTRYALDSVRSSVISVAPAKAGAPDAKILTVTDLAAYRDGKPIATLSGSLPFAWSRPPGVGLFSGLSADQPLHADLRAGDLSALAALAPDLLDPKRTGGALTASVDVRGGGGGQDALSARVTIADASLALAGFDTYFTKINGGLALDGDKLTVSGPDGLTAHSNKGGTLSLTGGGTVRIVTEEDGSLGVRGAPDLRVSAKDLRVDENTRQDFLSSVYGSSVRGRINGDVVITAPNDPSVAQPWLSPLIATPPGAPLLVSDTTAALPSKTAPEAAPSLAPVFDPRFALVLDLGGGKGKTTSVQNPLLKAEANGDVHIEGRRSAPEVRAHLTVARGQIILPPATLLRLIKPQDASANTVDLHYPYYDPTQPGSAPTMQTRVDVTGQAKVTVSPETLAATQSTVRGGFGQSGVSSVFSPTSDFGGAGRYTITAHIHGDLNGSDLPNLDLTSSPGGLTRPQMLAALVPAGALTNVLGGGGGAEKTLEKQFVLALNQIAVPTLLSPIEQGVAQSLGLTDFSVNYSPDAPVLVTLSKDLAPRLQVTYIRSIGARTPGAVNSVLAPPQYTIKLGYGLLNNLQISASTDDQRNNTLALEGVFRF